MSKTNEQAASIERRAIQDTAWFNVKWEAGQIRRHVAEMKIQQPLTDKAMPYETRQDMERCIKSIQEILAEDDKR